LEAALVNPLDNLAAVGDKMTKEQLRLYIKQLSQDVANLREELTNSTGSVVPSVTSQMNARADTVRASSVVYEANVNRVQEEIAKLHERFSMLGSVALNMEDMAEVEHLTEAIKKDIKQMTDEMQYLMVDRRATMANSNMTTTSFLTCVDGKTLYHFEAGRGPVPVDSTVALAVDPSQIRSFHMRQDMPPGLRFATVTAQWVLASSNEADDQNILGGTGKLIVMTDDKSIDIPVIDATEELLSYYRAHLLNDGDYFHFETQRDYPLFMMDIGENYIKEFIMKKKKGLYLEYHNEPHYHEPVNEQTRGCYCLVEFLLNFVANFNKLLVLIV
jgi:hypothetical protein